MSKDEQRVDFGTALDAMKEGCKVTRSRWLGRIYIGGPESIAPGRILIEIGHQCGKYVVTEEDILATDWEILENENE